MADELELTMKAVFTKTGTLITFPDAASQVKLVTVTGNKFSFEKVLVATTGTTLPLGGLTSGYLLIINRDSTNFVQLAHSLAKPDNLIRLKAGDMAMFRIDASAAPYALANVASCLVEYLRLED